jgi:hypothetical protein
MSTSSVSQQQRCDHCHRHGRYDRIPEAVVDVAGGRDDGGREQRQHTAKETGTDVIWQTQGRVTDPGRKQLNQKGSDRAVHHGSGYDHGDYQLAVGPRE